VVTNICVVTLSLEHLNVI
jgi:hypothetical protein